MVPNHRSKVRRFDTLALIQFMFGTKTSYYWVQTKVPRRQYYHNPQASVCRVVETAFSVTGGRTD